MMNYNLFLLICLPIVILCSSSYADPNIVNDTCRRISNGDPNVNYDFCTLVLGPNPNSQNASLEGLGVIAFKLTITNATATICRIRALMKDNRFDDFTHSCLGDCLELYSDGKSSLQNGLKSFRVGNYQDANIKVSAAIDAPTTCEDGFGEKKGEVCPMMKENHDFFELTAIALAFTNMFH